MFQIPLERWLNLLDFQHVKVDLEDDQKEPPNLESTLQINPAKSFHTGCFCARYSINTLGPLFLGPNLENGETFYWSM